MSLANKSFEQLLQDPGARRLARERADAIKIYENELAVTHATDKAKRGRKGLKVGRAEGRAEFLLKHLGLRFGRLSVATHARIQKATPEQIDAWAERVLTARTLAEVFVQ